MMGMIEIVFGVLDVFWESIKLGIRGVVCVVSDNVVVRLV